MERYINLATSNAVPIRERDDAITAYNEVEADIKAAKEQLKKAEIDRGYTEITAPISGIIVRSLIPEGSLVTSNQEQPMAIINQLTPVYIDIPLPVSDMLRKRKLSETGSAAQTENEMADIELEDGSFLVDSSGKKQQSEVLFSETIADEATSTITLRLSCDNPTQLLLPGMYVKANVPLQTMEKAFLVPKRSYLVC